MPDRLYEQRGEIAARAGGEIERLLWRLRPHLFSRDIGYADAGGRVHALQQRQRVGVGAKHVGVRPSRNTSIRICML